jgi:hypothetical protein
MVVAGWIAEQKEWRRLEAQWSRCIERQNAKSRPDQKITRYHAAPMNGYDDEFKNWDEDMSKDFSANLIRILKRRQIALVGVGCDMEALKDVFPIGPDDRRENAYGLCVKQVMVSLGHIMRAHFPNDQVMLVHDHGDWDMQALTAYNLMVEDKSWPSRHFFHSLTSLTSKESIGLQAADLIAYETFKRVYNRLVKNSNELRWALRQFAEVMPSDIRLLGRPAINALRERMKESVKHAL